jgi:hypothetical protein
MIRSISIISLVFICIFACAAVSVVCHPVHAGEPIVGNVKATDKVASRDVRDEDVLGKKQPELTATKGLEYITTKKDPKTQGTGFIKLKQKLEDESTIGSQKTFDVEFTNEMTGHKTKKDPDGNVYMKFEKIEDPEKNNILIRKEITKDYKTELSMGYRVSPFSEIYLGKGFLVDRKDNFNVDTHDNGWRLKFKYDF